MRLSDLDRVPDEIVRTMVPVLVTDGRYQIEGKSLFKKDEATDSRREVYRFTPEEGFILRQLDGRRTLTEIASCLEREFPRDHETAYAQVKSLFLTLAKRMICIPAEPHDR
jgi:hypothetical protein